MATVVNANQKLWTSQPMIGLAIFASVFSSDNRKHPTVGCGSHRLNESPW